MSSPLTLSLLARFACLSLVAFALTSCGGGGGGDGDGDGNNGGGGTVSESGLQATSLTRENSAQLTDALITFLFIGGASSSELSYLQFLLAEMDIEEGDFNEPLPCEGGSASVSGNVSQNGTGTIRQTYNNCRPYSGSPVTLNGGLSLVIQAADSNEVATRYTLEFDSYEYRTDDNQVFRYDGSIRIDNRVPGESERVTLNMQLHDVSADTFITAEELQFNYRIYDSLVTAGITNLTGQTGHSSYGLVEAAVDNETALYYLNGASDTVLHISINESFPFVELALDSDGDNALDAFLVADLLDLEDTPVMENTPPGFIGEANIEGQRGAWIELDLLYNTYDDDRDFLDYSIALQDSPTGSDVDLELSGGRYLRFQADVPGDYVIAVTISDARGGDITVPLVLNLLRSPPELAVTDYQATLSATEDLQLTLAPLNPEEGPFFYSLKAAPTGMVVDNDGNLTWSAGDSDFFFPVSEVNAVVEVSNGDHSIDVPISIEIENSSAQMPLARSSIRVPNKEHNIHVGDFDDDGTQEVLLTDNGRLIYTLEWNGSDYVQDWVFPYDISGSNLIDHIFPWDEDGDGRYEIYVQVGADVYVIEEGLATSRHLFNASELLGSSSNDSSYGYGLVITDLNGDSLSELILLVAGRYYSSAGDLIVANLTGSELLWSVNDIDHGQSLAVANVDADDALELILAGGYVYDGATQTNQWLYGSDFGRQLVAGDIDGDGIAEIIASRNNDTIAVYSAVSNSLEYTINQNNVCSMALLPLDADIDLELVAAGCSSGVRAWDDTGGAATEVWSLAGSPEATSLFVGDSDGDGSSELLWAGEWDYSRTNTLVVMDVATQVLEYESADDENFFGPFYGGYAFSDGVDESAVLFSVSQSGYYGGGRLISLDASSETFDLSDELDNNSSYRTWMAVSDYDIDGVDEIIYSIQGFSFDDGFAVYDFFNDVEEWRRNDTSANFTQLSTGLLNDDVYPDLAIVESRSVEFYDLYNQLLIWSSSQFDYAIKDILVHDLEGDGEAEVLLLFNNRVQVLRSSGSSYVESEAYNFEEFSYPVSLQVENVDGAGQSEILVLFEPEYYGAGNQTKLLILDDALSEFRTINITGRVTTTASTGNNDGTLLVGVSYPDDDTSYSYYGEWPHRVQLISLDAGQAIWQSPALVGTISQDSLNVIEDGMGNKKLAIGTSDAMLITR